MCNRQNIKNLKKFFFGDDDDRSDWSPKKHASQESLDKAAKIKKEQEVFEFEEAGGVEAVLKDLFVPTQDNYK